VRCLGRAAKRSSGRDLVQVAFNFDERIAEADRHAKGCTRLRAAEGSTLIASMNLREHATSSPPAVTPGRFS